MRQAILDQFHEIIKEERISWINIYVGIYFLVYLASVAWISYKLNYS